MSDHSFGAEYRLRDSNIIKEIRLKGERIKVFPFLVYRLNSNMGHPRIAIGISRRAGPSVVRNYFKRFLREFFRAHRDSLGLLDYYFFCAADLTKFQRAQKELLKASLLKRLRLCRAS